LPEKLFLTSELTFEIIDRSIPFSAALSRGEKRGTGKKTEADPERKTENEDKDCETG
jgi:hypothetical protein